MAVTAARRSPNATNATSARRRSASVEVACRTTRAATSATPIASTTRRILALGDERFGAAEVPARGDGVPLRPGAVKQPEGARGITWRQAIDPVAIGLQRVTQSDHVMRGLSHGALGAPQGRVERGGGDGLKELIGAVVQ